MGFSPIGKLAETLASRYDKKAIYGGRTIFVERSRTKAYKLLPSSPGGFTTVLTLPYSTKIPLTSFKLTDNPTAKGIREFLSGMIKNDFKTIHDNCKPEAEDRITNSIMTVQVQCPQTVFFPIFGTLKANFIPINPSSLDLFCNEIFREWLYKEGSSRVADSYNNAYQSLIATAFAFKHTDPTILPPMSDAYFSEIAYLEQGEALLQEIMYDRNQRDDFRAFAKQGLDISRPTRYLHFIDYLVSSNIGQLLLERDNIRILDVGGCPYSPEHGAPAARMFIETLQHMYPGKTFNMVVSDKYFPKSFTFSGPSVVDTKHANITYSKGDIVKGSPEENGFDIVICNRVLTEPFFQDNLKNYEAARNSLYNSLKDKNSILFLDQGSSHWVEIWQKTAKNISHGRYYALMNRIDNWFLVATLKLASDPRLKLRDAKTQISKKYGDAGVPPFLWSTAAKYFKSLKDNNERHAVILWRICIKTDGKPINKALKNEGISDFLRKLSPLDRQLVQTTIDHISNPETIDLRDIDRLDEILSQINLKIDKETLFFSKLQTTVLDSAITAALGLERPFLQMGGVINKVSVKSSGTSKREYYVEFRLYGSDEPLKLHRVIVTVIPSTAGETHLVKKAELI